MSTTPRNEFEGHGDVDRSESRPDDVPEAVRQRAKIIGDKIVMGSLTYFYWLVGQALDGSAAMGDLNEAEERRTRQRAIRLAESTLIGLAHRELRQSDVVKQQR